jgi:hypothetical protein
VGTVPVKLHRCSAEWVKFGGHPCWRVERALQQAGIEYEIVAGPGMPWQRKQRTELIRLTGQDRFPAIEFEDGSVYRKESKEMVATIESGKLFDEEAGGVGSGDTTPSGAT